MRYKSEQKQQTRERILNAAGTVFRRMGYQAAGVDKVMAEAGLTAGGFYAHFRSKEALLAETIPYAARKNRPLLERGLENATGTEWVSTFVGRYLSMLHRNHPERGCPLPALLPEVGRADNAARLALEELLKDYADRFAARLPQDLPNDRALAVIALMVGGIALSRAVVDETLAERVLAACRSFVDDGLTQDSTASSKSKGRGSHSSVRTSRRTPGEEKS